LVDEISVRAGPARTKIGKCCVELGRAGFRTKCMPSTLSGFWFGPRLENSSKRRTIRHSLRDNEAADF
jgi:hypothetical protein